MVQSSRCGKNGKLNERIEVSALWSKINGFGGKGGGRRRGAMGPAPSFVMSSCVSLSLPCVHYTYKKKHREHTLFKCPYYVLSFLRHETT